MRVTFLADAQAALLAFLLGNEAQANSPWTISRATSIGRWFIATQRLSKLALERLRSYADCP